MKFAHLSDLHIGSWREPKLREANMRVFLKAMDMCVEEKVDFILFAGDLFNTSLPAIDKLNVVVKKLKKIMDLGIPVYVIPGSHDFSPSGKTMIDVLESAGLFVNVCKKEEVVDQKLRLRFVIDKKTGAKITGMLGKKGMLDRVYYEDLDRESLEEEEGYKIFMFHTALSELKPKHLENMESYPISLLPRGFDYYAGGHVHHRNEYSDEEYKVVTQPGALFPNNFAELEKYGYGGFYIVEDGEVAWKAVKVVGRIAVCIECDKRTPEEVNEMIAEEVEKHDVEDTIVTIRVKGMLQGGKVSDIDFKNLFDSLYGRGAYFVMKNTSGLQSEEFEEIKVEGSSVEDVEDAVMREHLQQIKVDGMDLRKEVTLTKGLMSVLVMEKSEGENARDFEERMKMEVERILFPN